MDSQDLYNLYEEIYQIFLDIFHNIMDFDSQEYDKVFNKLDNKFKQYNGIIQLVQRCKDAENKKDAGFNDFRPRVDIYDDYRFKILTNNYKKDLEENYLESQALFLNLLNHKKAKINEIKENLREEIKKELKEEIEKENREKREKEKEEKEEKKELKKRDDIEMNEAINIFEEEIKNESENNTNKKEEQKEEPIENIEENINNKKNLIKFKCKLVVKNVENFELKKIKSNKKSIRKSVFIYKIPEIFFNEFIEDLRNKKENVEEHVITKENAENITYWIYIKLKSQRVNFIKNKNYLLYERKNLNKKEKKKFVLTKGEEIKIDL